MIFFIITFIATTIGGIAGMGGGVIIKPALDFLGVDLETAAVLCAVTVLTMTIVSVIKQARMKFKFDKQLLMLALSALVGGAAGNQLFIFSISGWSDRTVNMIQIIISVVLLLFALLKDVLGKSKFKSPAAYILAGFLLGAVSTFVGIGGGPINVAVLVVFFGFDVKKAAIGSIFMIMFAQAVNVVTMMITGDMFEQGIGLNALWYMVPAAVIGGFLGSVLNRKLHLKHVNIIFSVAVILVIALNIYNFINLFV